jgi:hypothetical protein
VTNFIKALIISLLFCGSAYADDLEFAWGYDHTNIDGFRLFIDGNTVKLDSIPPAARTVIVAEETDGQPHAYHLVAYRGDIQSGPSATVIVTPEVIPPPPPEEVYGIEGQITFRRIK